MSVEQIGFDEAPRDCDEAAFDAEAGFDSAYETGEYGHPEPPHLYLVEGSADAEPDTYGTDESESSDRAVEADEELEDAEEDRLVLPDGFRTVAQTHIEGSTREITCYSRPGASDPADAKDPIVIWGGFGAGIATYKALADVLHDEGHPVLIVDPIQDQHVDKVSPLRDRANDTLDAMEQYGLHTRKDIISINHSEAGLTLEEGTSLAAERPGHVWQETTRAFALNPAGMNPNENLASLTERNADATVDEIVHEGILNGHILEAEYRAALWDFAKKLGTNPLRTAAEVQTLADGRIDWRQKVDGTDGHTQVNFQADDSQFGPEVTMPGIIDAYKQLGARQKEGDAGNVSKYGLAALEFDESDPNYAENVARAGKLSFATIVPERLPDGSREFAGHSDQMYHPHNVVRSLQQFLITHPREGAQDLSHLPQPESDDPEDVEIFIKQKAIEWESESTRILHEEAEMRRIAEAPALGRAALAPIKGVWERVHGPELSEEVFHRAAAGLGATAAKVLAIRRH